MLRLERVGYYLQSKHNMDMDITKCLNQVVEISQETQAKQSTISNPFITIDMGESGSNVWFSYLNRRVNLTYWIIKAEETISTLSHGEWNTIKEWEESFNQRTGGIENSAYIAALQRTLASRADCLILVGGGNFQSIALRDYIKNHPDEKNQCVKIVCALDGLIYIY